MCSNPLNAAALNWRSPDKIAGTITIDGQLRSVGNFLLTNPGTANLIFANLLPGGLYRFAVNANGTSAQLNLPLNAYFSGGAAINLTFTGNQWYLYDFVFYNGTIIITPAGSTIAGSFASLVADNIFSQVKLTGFIADIKAVPAATYDFLITDTAKILRFTNGPGCTASLKNNVPAGWMVTAEQSGASQVAFVLEAGATLQNRSGHSKTAGQYAVVSIYCNSNVAGNNAVFTLSGDTGA